MLAPRGVGTGHRDGPFADFQHEVYLKGLLGEQPTLPFGSRESKRGSPARRRAPPPPADRRNTLTHSEPGSLLEGSVLLNPLSSGNETPTNRSGVKYGTFRSWCDEVINPHDSTILSGAYNHQVGCIGHITLLGSWSVYTSVREFVRW